MSENEIKQIIRYRKAYPKEPSHKVAKAFGIDKRKFLTIMSRYNNTMAVQKDRLELRMMVLDWWEQNYYPSVQSTADHFGISYKFVSLAISSKYKKFK